MLFNNIKDKHYSLLWLYTPNEIKQNRHTVEYFTSLVKWRIKNIFSLDLGPRISHDINEVVSFFHASFNLLEKFALEGNLHSSFSIVNIPLDLLSKMSNQEKNINRIKWISQSMYVGTWFSSRCVYQCYY